MKVSDMSTEQKSHFWKLFIRATKCRDKYPNFSTISGFEKVWRYVEKEHPGLWKDYCCIQAGDSHGIAWLTFYNTINLDNLLTFLEQNKDEWGWEECPLCCPPIYDDDCSKYECDGIGKIRHPALRYLEEL